MGSKYKILALSDDHILKKYTIEQLKSMFNDIDFIISCGDVSYDYLDYVVSVLNKQLIYVNGNHVYGKKADSCGRNIDMKITKFENLRILGIDGSRRYSEGAHQYSELEMKGRILAMLPKLLLGIDLVISHSPPRFIHDKEDNVHRGFRIFNDLIKFLRPKLWLHGHIHLKDHRTKQESIVGSTKVVNVYGYKIIEIEV